VSKAKIQCDAVATVEQPVRSASAADGAVGENQQSVKLHFVSLLRICPVFPWKTLWVTLMALPERTNVVLCSWLKQKLT
jgi:hypothetical protein